MIRVALFGLSLLIVTQFVALRSVVAEESTLLKPEDRVAIVGGTLIERMQYLGSLEAEIQCRRPDWKLRFRNLGWSGDDVTAIARKVFNGPADGVKRLLSDLEVANPTVVLLAYGTAEAGDPIASRNFETGYRQLIATLAEKPYRLILAKPLRMPGYRMKGYEQSIKKCQDIVESLAQELSLPVLDAGWEPTDEYLNERQLLPSEEGYRQLAIAYADSLVGGEPCETSTDELRSKIVAKNELFFHRHRPQNETYLFLFRKHEQGNNAVEIPQFDPLINEADETIWKTAQALSAGSKN